jgi:hypothetical protein
MGGYVQNIDVFAAAAGGLGRTGTSASVPTAMIRPMNEWESTLGILCDAFGCGDLATHCESETTDFPLFLCTAHAVEHAMIHGGSVRTDLPTAGYTTNC